MMFGYGTFFFLFCLDGVYGNLMPLVPLIPLPVPSHKAVEGFSSSSSVAKLSSISSQPSSTPIPRISTHAYCTPNNDPEMCALGIGIRNPTQFYNKISQDTMIDFSFWDSKCQAMGERRNFTVNHREGIVGFYLPQGGNVTIDAVLPAASYEHCHDAPLGEAQYTTCQSKDWAEFPCGCEEGDGANYGYACEATLYDKCVLKPGYLELNSTSSKGISSIYWSTLNVNRRADPANACNCDKKYFNDCPKDYVFCCGCEFRCDG